jgi:hemolysin III
MSNQYPVYPAYTLSERIADGVIHTIGVTASLTATIIVFAFVVPYLPAQSATSLVIYGVAMVAMFSFSAAYHMIPVPHWKGGLRRLDQAAIFLKIAATYTPFAVVSLGGLWGYGLLGAVWSVAVFGIVVKLFRRNGMGSLTVGLYLALGWAGIFVVKPLFDALPLSDMALLTIGGVLYSVGVIFHMWEKLPFQNAIWHLFVLAAASCHFAAVVHAVALA